MTIKELLASYDPVDAEYKKRFHDSVDWHLEGEDRGGHVFTGRKMKTDYMSFIPDKEETEKILLAPLRKSYLG